MVINMPGVALVFFTKNKSMSDYNGSVVSVETTSLFMFANVPYIVMNFVFMMEKPFRAAPYKNVGYLINLILISSLSLYIIVYPANWLTSVLEVSA
jgi:hypothetical protein